jgi:hypothetical protein
MADLAIASETGFSNLKICDCDLKKGRVYGGNSGSDLPERVGTGDTGG